MAQFLNAQAHHYSDEEMLRVDGVGRTYVDLLHDSRSLAAGLASFGVGAGSRVGLLMDTSHQAVDVWFALSMLGAVDAPFNCNYRGSLLLHLIEDSEVSFIVCDAQHLAEVERMAAQASRPLAIVVNGQVPPGGTSLQELYLDPEDRDVFGGDAGEVILYTSGTTGPSKGVVHSQRGCILLAQYVAEVCGYRPGDRLLNFFPLYHQNARYTGVLAAIAAGAAIDLESRFTSSGFWRLCRDRGITAFNYLGSVLTMIIAGAEQDPDGARGHSVRVGWGAGASERDRLVLRERFGVELVEVYGLTEAPMATVNLPGSGCPSGSAGRASDFFEVRILADHGGAAEVGEAGGIQLRPRIPDVFTRGYHGNDSATVAATRDLWFDTGDRGYLTAEGDLFFAERAKDSLRRRGENISAWEVESVLVSDARVVEAAVYGVPVDGDEEVMAALLLDSAEHDPRRIIADIAGNLPRYAVPRFVRVVADMPRTPTMKVQKNELKKEGVTSDTLDLVLER
ncbi:AMP-binding protein [Microbacterium sp. zg.Y625]|uniref:AMP-binding protein n=1 Tax=Microbacterium jiangjiandongii TaxID=3049071 RepID=UPI00214B923E|nr:MULTISPECIES: AMP-binding protein [unclassified Microbacterium]MCR2793474.1 AMP-binding protein [Microbacterium sp. zg.Y625]MCR2815348.1 AMP-binding protein [Microbacterium sp. zg.Y843]WIM26972.1 AMP-binding protein [Microbacterium sp. zg-Y625]